jgi:ABC-type transport system substrate-binding protein
MRRREFLIGSALAASGLASPAIVRAQGAKLLKFVPQADLAVLDPVWTTAYVTRNHAAMVFDTLYGQDSSFRTSPQMVEGHVVENDGLQWTLTLRDGLKFHDDTPVLARDCVASIQRWGKRDSMGMLLMAACDEVSAPGDRKIVFKLKRPFPQLPDVLGKATNNLAAIMPERIAQTDPFKQVTEMVGSGPFRFKTDERQPGALAVYEKFAGYIPCPTGTTDWMAGPKLVKFDRVEWHTIADSSTASSALQTGGIDWWELPIPDLLPILKQDANLKVELQDPAGYIGIMRMNQLHPPFDNPAIRRAVLRAVAQADFMQAAVGDDKSMWKDGVGFFCPGTPMASAAGMPAPLGIDDARKAIVARLQGREDRHARRDRHPDPLGRRRGRPRPAGQARLQCRLSGDRLGHGRAAPRQARWRRGRRLERDRQLHRRARPAQPDDPHHAVEQWRRRRARLADQRQARGTARQLALGPGRGEPQEGGRGDPGPGLRGRALYSAWPVSLRHGIQEDHQRRRQGIPRLLGHR